MPIQIRYPSTPIGVDTSGLERGLAGLGERFQQRRQEKRQLAEAEKIFGDMAGGNSGGLEQFAMSPMSLDKLAPHGGVTRAPLPAVDSAPVREQAAGNLDNSNGGSVFGRFMKAVQGGGLTNGAALAAVAATGNRESGFKPENASGTWSDPSQSGQPGTAGGIMSWRGPRLQALQAFASQNGEDPSAPSPEMQAQFLLQENPDLIAQLQQAKTPQEAQQLMNAAWKYAGFDQPGGETAARMAEVEKYAPQFAASSQSPSQSALENMAVGESMPMGGGGQPTQGFQPISTGGFGLDPKTMAAALQNPITRPFAIEMAKSRMAAMQDERDPMKKLAFEKALIELDEARNPRPKITDDMAEYQFAQKDPQFGQYQIDQKRSASTQVNVGAGEKAWDQESAKLFAKRYDDLSASAGNAQQMLGMYDLAEEALGTGVRTGFGAETELNLRQLGSAMGIDTNPEQLAGGELIRAIQNRMALTMRSPDGGMGMPGALSDRDIKFLKDSQIGIDRSPQGNAQMLQAFRAMEQRKIEMAQLADQYVQENGRLDAGFNQAVRAYAKANPLFPEKPTGSGATPGAGGSNGRTRARNPQTGAEIEWDGTKWSPVR